MKTSKVKWTQSTGTFKDMNVTEVEFENGDCGNNYHKTETTRFQVGKSYQYEIKEAGKTPSIKFIAEAQDNAPAQEQSAPAPKQYGKSPEESNRIARMNALTNAINYSIEVSKIERVELLDVLVIAQEFEKFICDGMQATSSAQESNRTNAGVKGTGIPSQAREEFANDNSDLPF
jgi:hypothetical protein